MKDFRILMVIPRRVIQRNLPLTHLLACIDRRSRRCASVKNFYPLVFDCLFPETAFLRSREKRIDV
jgi:hypothetical protein